MLRNIRSLQDVVDWELCIGCGACYFACDKGSVSLVNLEGVGIRPRFSSPCDECVSCLPICPGAAVDGDLETGGLPKTGASEDEFGPTLEIWEGFATDSDIRFRGSSGGLLSAISLFCLERLHMVGVVHSAMDPDQPWTNKTVVSRTREEIVSRAGSRYAPSSPCDGLDWIRRGSGSWVFIGKPCDSSAVGQLRRRDADLDKRLGLVLTFFCAGTPSTEGTRTLIRSLDVSQSDIREVHYRGEGWPGRFRVRYGRSDEKSLSYKESWRQLTGYRSLRCNLCPDGLGRVADISCGDAWNEFEAEDSDPGRSLVLVRTERGRQVLQSAREAGYVTLRRVGAANVLAAQESLLGRRHVLFGRLLAMRLFFFMPVPDFRGFSLVRGWLQISFRAKAKSVLGTVWRIVRRGWWRRRPLFSNQRVSRSREDS